MRTVLEASPWGPVYYDNYKLIVWIDHEPVELVPKRKRKKKII